MSHHHYEDVIDTSKKTMEKLSKEEIDQEIEHLENKKAQIEKDEQIKKEEPIFSIAEKQKSF